MIRIRFSSQSEAPRSLRGPSLEWSSQNRGGWHEQKEKRRKKVRRKAQARWYSLRASPLSPEALFGLDSISTRWCKRPGKDLEPTRDIHVPMHRVFVTQVAQLDGYQKAVGRFVTARAVSIRFSQQAHIKRICFLDAGGAAWILDRRPRLEYHLKTQEPGRCERPVTR